MQTHKNQFGARCFDTRHLESNNEQFRQMRANAIFVWERQSNRGSEWVREEGVLPTAADGCRPEHHPIVHAFQEAAELCIKYKLKHWITAAVAAATARVVFYINSRNYTTENNNNSSWLKCSFSWNNARVHTQCRVRYLNVLVWRVSICNTYSKTAQTVFNKSIDFHFRLAYVCGWPHVLEIRMR